MELQKGEANKTCSQCKETFPATFDYFYKQKVSNKSGVFYRLASYCKECYKTNSKKWAAENHEASKASKRKYTKTDTGRIKIREGTNKRRKSGAYKKWQSANPEKLKEYNKKYSNKKHTISKKEWIACKEYFNYECAYCGMNEEEHKKIYKQQLHKEHVIHEGRSDIKNCIPSCKVCNSSKHTFTLNQWYNEANNINYTRENYLRIYKWIRYECKLINNN